MLKFQKIKKAVMGASLLEYGMVTGLISISSIFAVQGLGLETKDVFCRGAYGIEQGLGNDTSDYSCVNEVAENTEEGEQGSGEVGYLDGNFVDAVFPRGTVTAEYVMLPLEGQLPEGGVFLTPAANKVLLCYQMTSTSDKECTSNLATTSQIAVPAGAYAIGYQKFFPTDTREEHSVDVELILNSNTANVASKLWSVNVSREAEDVLVNPSFDFSDVVVGRNVSTYDVMERMTGEFNGAMKFSAVSSGFSDVQSCVQITSSSEPVCSTAIKNVAENTYSLGYRLTNIPSDPRSAYSRDVQISLKSILDPSTGEDWSVTASRVAEPIVLTTGFDFEDYSMALGTTGLVTVMKTMAGDYNGAMTFTSVNSGTGAQPYTCIQETSTSGISCLNTTTVSVPATTYAIGYRLTDIPADTRAAYSKAMKIDLYSSLVSSVRDTWEIVNTRVAEAIQMAPSFNFADADIPGGSTGPFQLMKVMDGDFNGAMRYSVVKTSSFGAGAQTCIQLVENGSITCAVTSTYVEIPETTYAIGYKLTDIPDDIRSDYDRSISINLRSALDANIARTWDITASRSPEPVQASPSFDFVNTTMPEGTSGSYRFMQPMTGDFNGDVKVSVTTGTSNVNKIELCVQPTADTASISCSTETGYKVIPASTYAIGYKITDVPDDTFVDFSRSMSYSLRSVLEPALGEDWDFVVDRTPAAIRFDESYTFPDQTIPAGTTGTYRVLQPLGTGFSGSIRFNASKRTTLSSVGLVRLCYQEDSASGAITCQASGNVVLPADTTYAIGYEIYNIPTNTSQAFSILLNTYIASSADFSLKKQETPKLTRTPQ